MNAKKTRGGPTTAQQVLSRIHSANAGTDNQRAHMIADIEQLIQMSNDLMCGVAVSTGQILNSPEVRQNLTKESADELTLLAGNLLRDSAHYKQQFDALVARFNQTKTVEDWPDFLGLSLAISGELADWHVNYSNVVLPIRDTIDQRIRSLVGIN